MSSRTDGQGSLLGRAEQQRALGRLITAARNQVSGSMLIRGEPGIGKTALLQDVSTGIDGVQLIRLVGFEAESSIPFSGLQRLAAPLAVHLETLPERYQQAFLIATGSIEGPPPERFLVGLAVLGLLAEAGQHTPVVCAIDEAHWLDSESLDMLAFVARRLQAECVVMLFAMRDDPGLDIRLAGIPTLRLGGLDKSSAIGLLNRSLPGSIDPLAAAQIAVSTGGNPLALIDLAAELTIQQLSESSLADEPFPVGRHLEAHYLRRAHQLPPDVRLWLLAAAADSTGNVDLLIRAARHLDLPDGAADQAERAGLIEIGHSARFKHPLVRSAVYNAASGADRRRAHNALSHAAIELDLAELDAWHAGKATVGTDQVVALRLEQVADRAGRRGGFASRANVLARAAALTPPGEQRNERLVAAAEAALAAGAAQIGLSLINDVDPLTLDRVQQCRTVAVRAAFALFTADRAELLRGTANMLEAAATVHGLDSRLEQTMLIRAFEYCLPTERLTQGVSLPELGTRLRNGADVADGPGAAILLGLSALILLPYAEAVPIMRRAVATFMQLDDDNELLRLGPVSVALTTALWDHGARTACLQRAADIARDAGSLQLMDTVLWILSLAELTGGTPRQAGQYIEQVRELRRAIGYDAEHVVNAAYFAWVGAPRAQVETLAEAMRLAGFAGVHSSAVAALAVRDLAEGHYRDAYHRLKPLVDDPFLQVTPLELPDFVEAAVRGGHPKDATVVVETLTSMALANGSAWTQGVADRSRALIAPDSEAEGYFSAAIESLAAAEIDVDLGRAHLLFGEWLRRRKRRREARTHLRTAMDLFERSGAAPFAQRARAELEATGERVTAGTDGDLALTFQETTVARLAAQGRTNAEIGASLFVSANTVDYHLRKVFQKLGISSRRQLAERLSDAG